MSRQFDKELYPARDPRYVPPHLIVAYHFGEAEDSSSVVRPAAVGRNTPNGYADPGIPSSSTAAARPGETNSSQGVVNVNTPPRPYHQDAYRDDKSAFNVEFRVETPPGFPSRVYARPHFWNEEDAFLDHYWARFDKELYEDGLISAETYKARLQDLREQQQHRRECQHQAELAEARQQDNSNAGSSSAADAAASETTAMGTDTDTLDFPSVVSSEVVSGTTAPAASIPSNASNNVNAADASIEADDVLNTGFAPSSADSSSNASTAETFVQPSVTQSADRSTTSSKSQLASNESRDISVDLMRGEEVLKGEDAENFCAKLRFRPRHQPHQHAEVEENRSTDEEEDSDEIQDLSTSFSLIGLTSRSMDVDEDIDAMSTSLASVATTENNIAVESNIQNTVAVASVDQPSPSAQKVEEQVSQIVTASSSFNTDSTQPSSIGAMSTSSANISESVEPMDVDPILEPIVVDEVLEKMEVDQVPEEHHQIVNNADIEMFDESIMSTDAIAAEEHANSEVNAITPIIDSDQSIQPSPHAVSVNNRGFFLSTNTDQVTEYMEVDLALAPEVVEQPVVNETHSAVISPESATSTPIKIHESNNTIESSETSSPMPPQPASESSVALTATTDVMTEDPAVENSSESLRESSSADQRSDSSSKPASNNIQVTNNADSNENSLDTPEKDEIQDSKKPESSRDRVNDVVDHHRRRARGFPGVQFSPQHSVMKRQSNTAQRSRLALVCLINRQRTQQMMRIKTYSAVVEKPVTEIAAHHRRQREMQASSQVSPQYSMPRPTTTGQRSRLALIEAQRARTQTAPESNVDRVPSATDTEDTSNAIPVTAAVVEQNTTVAPSEQVNEVSSKSAIEERIVAVNHSGSKIRRIGRPQYTDLERAFARQRQRAPITRQELEHMFAFAERFNNTREAVDAIPTTSQQRQPSTSGSPTVLQQQRRPFQGRVTRLWLTMQNDGRPVRRAVQQPRQFYSNEESPIRRKQEGEECKASSAASTENTQRPAVSNVDVEDHPIEEAQTDRESSVASTSQPNSSTDQAGDLTSNTVASDTPRTHRRYRDSVRRNRAHLQYEADSEGEDARFKSSKKKVNKRSHKKGLPKCKCTHPEHLKYSCNHAVHDVMKEIARKYLICRWCDLPYARRLITSEDERSESEDEGANEDHANASGSQTPPAERPSTPVEADEQPEDIVQFEPIPDPEEELDVVERSRPSKPVEAPEEPEDIVQFEPMSDLEEDFDVGEGSVSRDSSQKRRNSTSSSDDDHIPTKRPRRDVYIDSSVDGDTDNESHHLPSDSDDDAQQPPSPTIRRARPDPNAPRWGRLTHITELEGINLPDAPRVVNMRDLIVSDNNQLTADMQTLVVSGENFQAALYEVNGVVVLLGLFNGTIVASKELQDAVNQPIILMNNPHDAIKQIAAGPNHLVMLGKSGRIYAVGCAKDGQLGIARPEKYRNSSIAPSALLRCVFDEDGNEVTFKTIRVEGNRTAGITEDGSEYSCGHEVGNVFVQTL